MQKFLITFILMLGVVSNVWAQGNFEKLMRATVSSEESLKKEMENKELEIQRLEKEKKIIELKNQIDDLNKVEIPAVDKQFNLIENPISQQVQTSTEVLFIGINDKIKQAIIIINGSKYEVVENDKIEEIQILKINTKSILILNAHGEEQSLKIKLL